MYREEVHTHTHMTLAVYLENLFRERQTFFNKSIRTLLRLETIPAIRFESCVIFPYGPIG